MPARSITLNTDLLSLDTAEQVALLVQNEHAKAKAEHERWVVGVPCGAPPVYDTGRARPLATLEPTALAALRDRRERLFREWSKMKRYVLRAEQARKAGQ
jgi:hypothetical protein